MQHLGSPTQEIVPNILLTIDGAAKALAVSKKTIVRLTLSGQIPRVMVGTSVRYRPVDLQAWVDSRVQFQKGTN